MYFLKFHFVPLFHGTGGAVGRRTGGKFLYNGSSTMADIGAKFTHLSAVP